MRKKIKINKSLDATTENVKGPGFKTEALEVIIKGSFAERERIFLPMIKALNKSYTVSHKRSIYENGALQMNIAGCSYSEFIKIIRSIDIDVQEEALELDGKAHVNTLQDFYELIRDVKFGFALLGITEEEVARYKKDIEKIVAVICDELQLTAEEIIKLKSEEIILGEKSKDLILAFEEWFDSCTEERIVSL